MCSRNVFFCGASLMVHVPRNKLGRVLMVNHMHEDHMLREKCFRIGVGQLCCYTKTYTKCLQSPFSEYIKEGKPDRPLLLPGRSVILCKASWWGLLEGWRQKKPRYRFRMERTKPRRGLRSLYPIYFHPRIIPWCTHTLGRGEYSYICVYVDR